MSQYHAIRKLPLRFDASLVKWMSSDRFWYLLQGKAQVKLVELYVRSVLW